MNRILCVAKIHNATVTDANLKYTGSLTIDEDLMDAVGIYPHERVQIVNLNNGNRLETYVMVGARATGIICMNGAAARNAQIGDKIIIIAYGVCAEEEAKNHCPKIVFLDEKNKILGKVSS